MPKGNAISKKQVILPAITAALVLMMAPAMLSTVYAQNPHFIRDPDCTVDSSGNLDCSGRVAGLGNELQTVQANLVADIEATFGCDNPGQGGTGIHIPPGQPTGFEDVEGATEDLPVRNGQVRFNLQIEAPEAPEDLECPGSNWRIVLVEITYDNVVVVIGDTTLDIGGPFSGTLIEV
jgi:hypothetical protein